MRDCRSAAAAAIKYKTSVDTALGMKRDRANALRRQPARVARKHRRLADVGEAEEEHHDALQPDAAAGVGERSIPPARYLS